MDSIEEQIVNHLTAWSEQRAGIERFAEMITAYYQVLIDGGIAEEFARLLVLQYQAGLLAQIGERNKNDSGR